MVAQTGPDRFQGALPRHPFPGGFCVSQVMGDRSEVSAMPFSRPFAIAGAFAGMLALLAPCRDAAAHTFCVTTSQELQDALGASSYSGAYANEINIIHVATGTYMTSGSAFSYYTMGGAALFLSGGYNADCTALTPKAALTVLDGGGLTPVLFIDGGSALISIGELTLQNGESSESGAGLRINDYELPFYNYGTVALSDLIIRNNHTSASFGGLTAFSGTGGEYFSGAQSQFVLEDCLFEGNSSDQNVGAGQIETTSATVLVFNNTISGNSVPDAAASAFGGLELSSTNTAQVSNNIFWNNTHTDFAFSASTQLLSNDYGVISGTPLTSNNNVSVDPQFVDAAGGDFHLAASSPLIAFSPLLEGVDLEGNPHPTSGKEDIGAYMETVFLSGFEP